MYVNVFTIIFHCKPFYIIDYKQDAMAWDFLHGFAVELDVAACEHCNLFLGGRMAQFFVEFCFSETQTAS